MFFLKKSRCDLNKLINPIFSKLRFVFRIKIRYNKKNKMLGNLNDMACLIKEKGGGFICQGINLQLLQLWLR